MWKWEKLRHCQWSKVVAVQFLRMHIVCPPSHRVSLLWSVSWPLHPSLFSTYRLFQLNQSCTIRRSHQGSCYSEIPKASTHGQIFIRWLLLFIFTALQLKWKKHKLNFSSLKLIFLSMNNYPPIHRQWKYAFWLCNKIWSLHASALCLLKWVFNSAWESVYFEWRKVTKRFDSTVALSWFYAFLLLFFSHWNSYPLNFALQLQSYQHTPISTSRSCLPNVSEVIEVEERWAERHDKNSNYTAQKNLFTACKHLRDMIPCPHLQAPASLATLDHLSSR